MDIQLFYFCCFLAFCLNLIIFYHIIKGATKSKELLDNSNMQLNIAVQIALKNGIDESLIKHEVKKVETAAFTEKRELYSNSKITKAQYLEFQSIYLNKYPQLSFSE